MRMMKLAAMPGMGELILIFGVAVLLFGGKKLPELGSALGESIKNFKKGIGDDDKKPTTLSDASSYPSGQIQGAPVASQPIQPAPAAPVQVTPSSDQSPKA